MSRFRIFLSSPVTGFEDYRDAIKQAAKDARYGGVFDFFWYEEDREIITAGYENPCDAIFAVAGHDFDAIFIFFKDYVGPGTIAELRYFEDRIIPNRAGCRVLWSKVESAPPYSDPVTKMLDELNNKHSLEIPEGHYPRNIKPEHLHGRFALFLWKLSATLRP